MGGGRGRTARVNDEDVVSRLDGGIEAAREVRVGIHLDGEVVRRPRRNLRGAEPGNRFLGRRRNALEPRVVQEEARACRHEQVVDGLLRYPRRQEQHRVAQLRQREDSDEVVEVRGPQDGDDPGLLRGRGPRGNVGLVDTRDSVGEDVELLHGVVDVLNAGGGIRHDDVMRVGPGPSAHQLVDGLDGAVVLEGRGDLEGLRDAVGHGRLRAEALGRGGDGGLRGHVGRRAGHGSGGRFTE